MLRFLRDPYFAGVTAAFLLFAAGWGLLLPSFESVDEQNHYRYMVFLKDHGRLPVQLPSPAESTGEGHQPPFYYALGALALRILEPSAGLVEPPRRPTLFNHQPVYFEHTDGEGLMRFPGQAWPVHGLRLLQLFALLLPGLLCLGLVLARLLDPVAARLAFAVTALNPAFLALAGALNNDHGAWVFGTAALACLLLPAPERPIPLPAWLGFGALAAAAALSKPTALGLLPAALVLVLRKPGEARRRGPWLACAMVAAALAPWFLRNLRLYGDPTAWNALVQDCPQCVHPKPLLLWRWWWFWIERTFETYWSVFGWMTWRAAPAVTLAFAGACGLALLGLAKAGTGSLGRPRSAAALAAVAGVCAVVLRHDLFLDPPAGRYFYAAALPIALFLGQGWGAFRPPAWAPWAAAAALAALNLWLLFGRMVPMYYPSA
jgi:hypothetical protein